MANQPKHGSDDNPMELIEGLMNPLTTQTTVWTVAPYDGDEAYGVPLYAYFGPNGDFVFTGVPALEVYTTPSSDVRAKFAAPCETQDMTLLLQDLEGVAPAVRDAIMACLAHKPMTDERGSRDEIVRVDPQAGCVRLANGEAIPGVWVASWRDAQGVLYVDKNRRGAAMRFAWAGPGTFTHNPSQFVALTRDITLSTFLSGLDGQKDLLTVSAIHLILTDPQHLVPDLLLMAHLERFVERLPPGDEARSYATRLIAIIQASKRGISSKALEYYISCLVTVRGLLAHIANSRAPGTEERFATMVNKPSWINLFDELVRALHTMTVLDVIDVDASELSIRDALHRLSEGLADPYTRAMPTSASKVVSAVGELATNPLGPAPNDDKVMAYVRRVCYIAGIFDWIGARPYDYCLMASIVSEPLSPDAKHIS